MLEKESVFKGVRMRLVKICFECPIALIMITIMGLFKTIRRNQNKNRCPPVYVEGLVSMVRISNSQKFDLSSARKWNKSKAVDAKRGFPNYDNVSQR